ncbi:hypothetical protein [Pseudomonas sp. Marseille-Q5115]|uniref:hypothetical protein n=1 Tax=Pseudomonas sp. Marseille-Q5115 TaxID=2866593 RepID=UPI001CE3EC0B|nr:hypothetical protein [Pseudomonas sp. Marseille-Q5115]
MPDATTYGKQLWLMLAATFDDATRLDGFGQHPQKAQTYIGFISAACGAMFAETGRETTMTMLAAIAQQVDKIQAPSDLTH